MAWRAIALSRSNSAGTRTIPQSRPLKKLRPSRPRKNTPKVAPDTIPKAREVVNEIVSGQFDKVEARYDDKMKAALPPGKLADTWKQLLGQTGGFKNITLRQRASHSNFQVATLVCEFERTTLDAVISFDADGTLGGIRFRPHKTQLPGPRPRMPSRNFSRRSRHRKIQPLGIAGNS